MSERAIWKPMSETETMNGSALATVSPGAIITTTELRAALQAAKEQQGIIGQFIKDVMTEGVDYGTIAGTERKMPDGSLGPNRTLYKPGAEKLISLFRCRPKFDLRRTENHDTGFYAYEFRCEILSSAGDVVAEGFGSASSRESKYRWRTAQRTCPKCRQPSVRSSNKEPGYYCWSKAGGCGEKFPPGDQAIEGQKLGRVENEDTADIANTVLKMAKKRAMVDAALALARCSDLFGHDIDDAEPEPPRQKPVRGERVSRPRATTQQAQTAKTADGEDFNQDTGEIYDFGDPSKPTVDEKVAHEEEQIIEAIGAAASLPMLQAIAVRCRAMPEDRQQNLRGIFQKRWREIGAAPEVGAGG